MPAEKEDRDGLDERKAGVRRTFDVVAQTYHQGPAFKWEPIGQRLVQLVAPAPGESVLDAACGAGSSAIPAAEAVGQTGSVLGLDLSEEMLALARRRVAELGLDHVELRTGDLDAIDVTDGTFDVVQCSLGVFFVADIPGALRELWRVLKPGGRIGLTSWAEDAFEPLRSTLIDSLLEVNPALPVTPPPYIPVSSPERWDKRFTEAGIGPVTVTVEEDALRPTTPDEAWMIAIGGGCRSALDAIDEADRVRVRESFSRRCDELPELRADATVLYALATKG